jgi:hypothetical protein
MVRRRTSWPSGRGLALAAAALAVSSCAAVWGFEPLSLGTDDGDSSTDGNMDGSKSEEAALDAIVDAAGDGSADASGNTEAAIEAGHPCPPDGGADCGIGCGADGQPCCTGNTCTSPLQCGGNGQTGVCASGLACGAAGGVCTCEVNPPHGNGQPCSSGSLGVDASDTVCCADSMYPSSGSCMCSWIGCATSGGTCICGPSNGTPGGSCAAAAWTCCIQTSEPECVCSSAPCVSGFGEAGNACAIADLKCGPTQHEVVACN